jgi:hypothetical protein
MALRLGLLAGARDALSGADAWFTERDVDVVVALDDEGPLDRLQLADAPAVTALLARSRAPEGPLVADPRLATGAPTVVFGGYVHRRESCAAGPVLELGQRMASGGLCECAVVEIARGGPDVWVWHEAGRLERDCVCSMIVETWRHDGRRWRSSASATNSACGSRTG